MKKEIDSEKIKEAARMFIEAVGDDPNRADLIETPDRVARMCNELFEGMRYTNDEIAEMFGKCFEYSKSNDLVIVKDIDIFSFCEHHIALMYNMKCHVGYIQTARLSDLAKSRGYVIWRRSVSSFRSGYAPT